MHPSPLRATIVLAVPMIGIALSAPTSTAAAQVGSGPRTAPVAGELVASVRAATERFQDVEVALAEGYIPDPTGMCVTAAMEGQPAELGVMGIHYFHPGLLGITAVEPRVNGTGTHTDFLTPGVLIYEPQEDGSLELVAVENLVFAESWRAAGNDATPEFTGNEYHYMHDDPATEPDEAHGFEPHYELHMWLYRENPNGMFTPFNPSVRCPDAPTHPSHGG